MNTTRRTFFARLAGAAASVIGAPLAVIAIPARTEVSHEIERCEGGEVGELPSGRKWRHRTKKTTHTKKFSDGSIHVLTDRDSIMDVFP